MKLRISADQIQLGLLTLATVSAISAFLAWGLEHFATAQDLQLLKSKVDKFDSLPIDIAVIKSEVHDIHKTVDKLDHEEEGSDL